MKTVFISYRRQDSAGYVRALHDSLIRHFREQQIFMDVADIPLGEDFVEVLDHNLRDCVVMLAVIGREWADIRNSQGERRLDNPNDFVRQEIVTALGRHIPVIPILVNGAPIPQEDQLPEPLRPLLRRQVLELEHKRFDAGIAELVKVLERYLGKSGKPVWYKRPLVWLPALAVLMAAGLWLWSMGKPDTPGIQASSRTSISTSPSGNASQQTTKPTTTATGQAGFDCQQAHSSTEKAICAHSKSREADRLLTDTYRTLLNSLPPPLQQTLRQQQQDWLFARDRHIAQECLGGNGQPQADCIENFYRQRGKTLHTLQNKLLGKAEVLDPPTNVRYTPNGSVRCQVAVTTRITIISQPEQENDGDAWYWTNYCGPQSWGLIHESQIRRQ